MKIKLSNIILLLLGLIVYSGCINEELTHEPVPVGTSSKIELVVNGAREIQTRSTATSNECYIEDAYLLIFDVTTGKYKYGERVDIDNRLAGINGAPQRTITTDFSIATGDKVVVLANTGCTFTNIPLTVGTATTDDINTAFPSSGWNTNRSQPAEGIAMPMSGTMIYGTDTSCELIRAVAKLEIVFADNLAENDMTGQFYWGNENMQFSIYRVLAPNKGLIYSPEYNSGVLVPSDIDDSDFTSLSYNDPFPIPEGTSFYSTEYSNSTKAKTKTVEAGVFDPERTCWIIEFKDKKEYYRIDLFNKETDKYLDIRRNCHYKIVINKVKYHGYPSSSEALANPGSNLEYAIHVSGEDDNVVVSNGQYAIVLSAESVSDSVSNTERIVLKAKYQLPAEMSSLADGTTNTISFSGTGMTASIDNPTQLTAEWQELKLTFGNSATEGEFVFKLGNITKVVPVNFIKSIGMIINGRKYRFAPGNLMYNTDTEEYYFAPNQGYYTGVSGEKWDPVKNTDYWYGGCLYTPEYYRWYYDDNKQFPLEIIGDPCTKVKPEGTWRTPSYEYLDQTVKTFSVGKYYDAENGRYVNGVFIDLDILKDQITVDNQDDYLFLPAAGEKYPTNDKFASDEVVGTDNRVGNHGFYWGRRKGTLELEADEVTELQTYFDLDFDLEKQFFYNGNGTGVNPKARFTVRCIRYGDDGTD